LRLRRLLHGLESIDHRFDAPADLFVFLQQAGALGDQHVLALFERLILFLELLADLHQFFEPLLDTLQFEFETVICLHAAHSRNIEVRSIVVNNVMASDSMPWFLALESRFLPNFAHSYDELAEIFKLADTSEDISEFHGGMSASLCVGGLPAARKWTEHWLQDLGNQLDSRADLGRMIDELADSTWSALTSSERLPEPLLPSDDAPLTDRVERLGRWCRGFLSGLGLSGWQPGGADDPTDAVNEILTDFAAIVHAYLDPDSASDENAAGFDLEQLVEYVRAGTQVLFESERLARQNRQPPVRD